MWLILGWASGEVNAFDDMPMRKIRALFRQWEKDSHIELVEIRSLLALIEKHSAPLEADLIKAGLRLRHCPSTEFNWRDLWVFVAYMDPSSSLYSAVNPDAGGWTRTNMLLADIADSASWLVWSKTRAASKGGTPPDRIPRPGVAKKKHRDGSKVKPAPLQRIREVYGISEASDPFRARKIATAFQ